MSVYLVPMVESIPSRRKHFTVKNIALSNSLASWVFFTPSRLSGAAKQNRNLCDWLRGVSITFSGLIFSKRWQCLLGGFEDPDPRRSARNKIFDPLEVRTRRGLWRPGLRDAERSAQRIACPNASQCGLDLFPAKPRRNSGAISL